MGRRTTLPLGGYLLTAVAALAPSRAAAAGPGGRAVLPLDGTWQFGLDPQGVGHQAKWFSADDPFHDTIRVPGAWQAQGRGTESDKLRHNYDGKAWYRREVAIPGDWTGRRVFLCIGGVHRYAEVWIDGIRLGEHIGYLSPFEYEITPHARPGSSAIITVCVDSKQRWDIDCLTGCFDIIDEMFTPWGGIWGHVTLEARNDVWIEDPFIQPRVSAAACEVTARLVGDTTKVHAVLLEVLSKEGRAVGTTRGSLTTDSSGQLKVLARIADARLWSPESPHLYTARLSILEGKTLVDRVEMRFGLREIEVRGSGLYLNGKKIFMHGYGDDSVYPQTMAAPSDKDFYLKRLAVAREYGFNYVRHHSTILPPDYYDAADEAGVFVSAEFPIAYMQYYQKAKGPALELYRTQWTSVIKRLRNHPSIFNWCMGNELWDGIPIGPDLYAAAKGLDPTRPVIDSDGLWAERFLKGNADRATLDFYQVQFDEPGVLPLDAPRKYEWDREPRKPVLSHETGNYATFPRMSRVDEYEDNFKPFWLAPARARLEKLGLLGESEQWSKNSERLYLLSHKLNTEAIRKNPRMSGYTWWLIQDYWTGSNGIVDTYFRAKDIPSQTVRQFNADVVLLENGLALTYRAGGPLRTRLLVSNYSQEAIREGVLRWQVTLSDRVAAARDAIAVHVGQGEVGELTEIQTDLPNLSQPQRATIVAELKAGTNEYRNDWSVWVYPAKTERPDLRIPLYAGCDLLRFLSSLGARPLPAADSVSGPAVYVVSQPSRSVIDAAAAGSCVVCLLPQGLFPTVPNRYKPAWWIGSDMDCNTGTVVYDNPVTRAVAPEGWCDAGWFRLLDHAAAYVLEDCPGQPQVLVRALDAHFRCRSKALLMQMGVGKGSLIVSGLNLGACPESRTPEGEWLLARLVEYAGTLPRPAGDLPLSFLREQVARAPAPEGPMLEGFARLISNTGETARERSYREAEAPTYVCRQTEPGHTIEWETAVVPDHVGAPTVTFVFAGSLGYKTQPGAEGFVLSLKGKELVAFNYAQGYQTWRSTDGAATLYFISNRIAREDAIGLFYLTVPAGRVRSGEPCRLAVRSKGRGSRRWFGLTPYADILVPRGQDKTP
jgi:beta-galactosidase